MYGIDTWQVWVGRNVHTGFGGGRGLKETAGLEDLYFDGMIILKRKIINILKYFGLNSSS